MFLLFSFLSFSRYFSCFYLFIYLLLLGAYCRSHNVRDSKFAVTKAYGFKLLILQYSFSLSFFLPSFFLSFLPFFLSFFLSFLKTSLGWRNEPRLKKRGSIGKSSLDYKIETRVRNRASITKSRLDCVIEPCMSRSGKTRYLGRFRSRVGLVYQKPWVIPFKYIWVRAYR